ncbi:hypothetical protein Chor_011685 [Crotalus horridus]
MQPRVSWMEKAEKEDPQYWDMNTRNFLEAEDSFKNGLETLRTRYNQSEGLHTWQRVYGCELQGEESKGGFDQFGYDGRTFLTFDKETLTWVAPVPQAQISQRKWDAVPGLNQGQKSYLEEICIEWLERYLSYGKETLLRTEPPEVTVSRKMEVEDGMETHVCRLHGFYPREIEASWTRDGEVWLQDTLRGSVAPNAEGTFHTTLSIQIDPKERGRYRCHVEHDSLPEPLDVALEEPKSSLGLIIGCVVAGLVLLGVIAVGIYVFFSASSHSLKYFYTSISEPSQGQPHFVAVGYVDGQVFVHYNSHSRRMQPQVSWMEKVGKENPQYWDRNTQIVRGSEEAFRQNLEIARTRYNQSEGFHIIQEMYGCELQADGRKGGFDQFGYEGRTFITFDKERLTWVAPQPQAQITQRKWDTLPGSNQGRKAYLEEICIEWLERYLSYGKETLLRTEPPVVTMSSRTEEVEDGMETHICRLDGFYPREIEASWTRDGEVWLQDTLRGSVAPNADGTFHTTLSIRIDPKERGRYRCHVEHDSLPKPLDVALKEPKSSLGIIIGCVVAGLALLGVIVGIWFFKRHQDDYKKAANPSDWPAHTSGLGRHNKNISGRTGDTKSKTQKKMSAKDSQKFISPGTQGLGTEPSFDGLPGGCEEEGDLLEVERRNCKAANQQGAPISSSSAASDWSLHRMRVLDWSPLTLPLWVPSRRLFALHEVFLHLHLGAQSGQPHFVCLGYVDDELFTYYDSHSRKFQPRVSWMEKVGKEDPQYWDRYTQVLRGDEIRSEKAWRF